jgi:hypothetical protein
MIKLKFADLNNEDFARALIKLSNEPGWANFQSSYNVAKILRRMKKELQTAREQHFKLLENYAKKDEKGGFLVAKEGTFPYQIEDDKREEYDSKMAEFLATEVELDCWPIKETDLGSIKLTPSEINTLDPIFDLQA